MGRRKIEIKPIKDDRNRSVTFLKRKGGLFKKAHELSVLCQVDVAVVIYGQNKKLYEYSSGDIHEFLARHNYYQKAHEHKGPADFADKGANDDEDESEDVTEEVGTEDITPPMHGVPNQPFPHQMQYQQLQHGQSPSVSPPMQQHMYQPHLAVSQSGSRPGSRVGMHIRRTSSNLVPQDHPHPQAQQPQQMHYGYAPQYAPYQQMGPPNPQHQMQMYQQQQQQAQMQQQPHSGHFSNPVPLHGQLQHMYLEEQRRQSLPPTFAMQLDPSEDVMMQPPQRPHRPYHSPPQGEQKPIVGHKRTAQISFTPVEDTRSMMSQPWPSQDMPQGAQEYLNVRQELGRSASIDVGAHLRTRDYGPVQQPGPPANNGGPGMRAVSMSGATGFGGHMRHNSLQTDLKRPRLTVQIPGEQAEASTAEQQGSGATESADSSAQGSGSGSATAGVATKSGFNRARGASGSVVLPPPSPSVKSPSSAGAVLSAGATGPKNPFARPPPPQNSKQPGSATQTFPFRENETPLSALPSRYLSGDLLPSPSQFYGGNDWTFPHNLVSPAAYQPTPIASQGPSWRDEDKRKSSDSSDRRN